MVIFSNPDSIGRWPDLRPLRTLGSTLLISLALHAAVIFFASPYTAAQIPIERSLGRISLEIVDSPNPNRPVAPERRSFPKPAMPEAPVSMPVEEKIQEAQIAVAVSHAAGTVDHGIQDMSVAIPAYSLNPPPEYPLDARRRWAEGLVLLKVRVSETGDVVSTSVDKTSGFAILDAAARQAVQRWKFVPASRGSRPMQSVCLIPIEFNLKTGVRVK